MRGKNEIQRWLLQEILDLGARAAWDKNKVTTVADPLNYTLDDINAHLNLPPGDRRFESPMSYCRGNGDDVYLVLALCLHVLGDAAKSQHYRDLSRAYQDSLAAAPSPQMLAYQRVGNQVNISGRLPVNNTGSVQTVNPLHPGPALALRRPDPVADPYLAANDFAEELQAHLGVPDVATLPVKAYMLWVAICAAQKDGQGWADLDARLHEVAGVPYVSAAERRARELAPILGALALAEWAVHYSASEFFSLHMIAGLGVTLSAIDMVEEQAEERVKELLARAPSAVTYTAWVDMDRDDTVITDGKTRRRARNIAGQHATNDAARVGPSGHGRARVERRRPENGGAVRQARGRVPAAPPA